MGKFISAHKLQIKSKKRRKASAMPKPNQEKKKDDEEAKGDRRLGMTETKNVIDFVGKFSTKEQIKFIPVKQL